MKTYTIKPWATLATTAAALGVGMPSLPKRRNYRRGGCERERQRHEWRARADAAAREWQRVVVHLAEDGPCDDLRWISHLRREGREGRSVDNGYHGCVKALDAALAAPKPWRRT